MASPILASVADKIYDILVEHFKAAESLRDSFVMLESTQGCSEWRFSGTLGFGGKFRNNDDRWYVDCYPEDSTPTREKGILVVNELLAKLKEHSNG